MSELIRFGVSLPKDLLEKFDRLIREKKYTNRSEALRDLIREDLVRKEWQENKPIAGAIILIYDHHHRELLDKVIDIQHDFQDSIISTQHVHLDHYNCLEIIALRGQSANARRLTDMLRALKGIKHAALSMSTTGKEIG
ncbi:MAG: nickel-responsive transcriptional regulator NikR [Candidatus Omnitrophota bacterium]|jgi:CopG family nickel-responsive transcriptional regulator